ncbi:MAG TPA: hypothetical protein VHJ20_00140 [Polyangia bacterium]|nr:hypothetical protein [Polyangia bacterium]
MVAIAVYAPALRNLYTLDDTLISSTAHDRASASLSTLFSHEYFGRYDQDTYRPFATLTSMFDFRIGIDPRHAAHAQNILWQAGAAALVFAFARRFLPLAAALVAGLFFAIHPGTTESTVSIGYREDAVVTCLLVASLSLTWSGHAARRGLALGLYALALFTKENAIVFPALVVVARVTLERPVSREKRRAWLRELAAFALVTAAYVVVRFGVMGSPERFADPAGGTYWRTLVAVPWIFAHYVRVLFWPWPLLALYAHEFPEGGVLLPQLPWIALDVGFLLVAFGLARSRPFIGFGLLWFAVALAPVLHFVPMRVWAADRFVHLSLVGGAFAAGATFAALQAAAASPAARRAIVAGTAAALVALLALTEQRIPVWHDDVALWRDTLRHNPRAYLGHFYLAVDDETHGRAERARARLRAAVDDCPRDSAFGRDRFCAYFASKLGLMQLQAGLLNEARATLDEALSFSSAYAPAIVGLGDVCLAMGDLSCARRELTIVTGLDPRLPVVRAMVDDLRMRLERAEAAAPAAK